MSSDLSIAYAIFKTVIAGLDPAIHPEPQLDEAVRGCPGSSLVKPGHDDVEA
jgi:hypothetical protein